VLRIKNTDDAGFTLVELLVTMVILGIIVGPLTAVVLGYLKNADATTARMTESHSAQIASSYLGQDVQAMGVRDFGSAVTDPANPYPLKQSVALGSGGGVPACGSASTPVVRMAWTDQPGGPGTPATTTVAAYGTVTDSGSTTLRRYLCVGSTLTSDIRIAGNVVVGSLVASCDTTCTNSGSTTPRTVSLTFDVHDPDSATDDYHVALTGERRQS
jgi:prepilin-type N-terminal cleavage/methylation domain-containing protein